MELLKGSLMSTDMCLNLTFSITCVYCSLLAGCLSTLRMVLCCLLIVQDTLLKSTLQLGHVSIMTVTSGHLYRSDALEYKELLILLL